tara:strand:+ start:490 stop:1257 length:768 start_codon:yes stop_codon:yes gene_type:complete
MKKAVVIPDQHFPIHDKGAFGCVLKTIELVKPEIVINIGDVGEWEVVSHWAKKYSSLDLGFHLPLIDFEIGQVNEELDKIDEICNKLKIKERYVTTGNHDIWLDQFVENKVGEHSVLKDYTFLEACHWKSRGWEVLPMMKPLTIGKLSFIHGAFTNMYHTKKHLDTYGASIIYGHTHTCQNFVKSRLDAGTIGAWSIGTIKSLKAKDNNFLRGRLHNWQHSVTIVNFWSNGNFQVEPIFINKGKCSVWGNEINGS